MPVKECLVRVNECNGDCNQPQARGSNQRREAVVTSRHFQSLNGLSDWTRVAERLPDRVLPIGQLSVALHHNQEQSAP